MALVGLQHQYLNRAVSFDLITARGNQDDACILFKAFHIPGCVNDINPIIITLNNGLRYILVNRDTGLEDISTAPSSEVLVSVGIFTLKLTNAIRKMQSGFHRGVGNMHASLAGSEKEATDYRLCALAILQLEEKKCRNLASS